MQRNMVVQGLICDRTNDSIPVRLQKVWTLDTAEIHLENLDNLKYQKQQFCYVNYHRKLGIINCSIRSLLRSKEKY
eukprot:UN09307